MKSGPIRANVRRLFGLAVRRPELASLDADAELDSIVEEHVAHLVSRGMDPAAARAEAIRALGGTLDEARQRVRDSATERERGLQWREWFDDARADARYAVRTLRRSPAFAATAIATLGLAIGANTVIFSAVSAVMLRPLPVRDPARLVALWETNPTYHWTRAEGAPANMFDWKDQVAAFEDVGGFLTFSRPTTLTGYGEPRLLQARDMTGNFFAVLGVGVEHGRTLRMDETWANGAPRPVVLGNKTWREVFGADTSIVGRSIQLDGKAVEVAGVLPASFHIPGADTDIWTSTEFTEAFRNSVAFRRAHFIRPVARLKPGVSAEQANANLQTVVARLQKQYPVTNAVMGAGMAPLHDFLVGSARLPLLVMLGAVGALLLIACANIGNLLLVRASGRERESALRLALGAGRGRLARQALTESAVLAVAGGVAGLALGWWGTRMLVAMQPAGLLPVSGIALSWTVLAYTSVVTIASAFIFGLAPALRTGQRAPSEVLKEDSRSSSGGRYARRWSETLVVAEVALSLMLALGAGLLVRSYGLLRDVDAGFDPHGVLGVSLALPGTRYDSARTVTAFFNELQQRAAAAPGVESVALTSDLPLTTPPWSSQFAIQGRPPLEDGTQVLHRAMSPKYQQVMHVPLRAGRFLSETDNATAPNAVLVNDALVRRFFRGESPVGQRIAFDHIPDSNSVWRTIVGVVGSEKLLSLAEDVQPEFIAPVTQDIQRGLWLLVRTTGDPALVGVPLRKIVAEMDPSLAIVSIRTMTDVRSAALARDRFITTLMLAFAGVGVVLGLVGVYGVVAQLARRRTREMGIRMALGAGSAEVQWLIVRRGLSLAIVGGAVGVGGALALTGSMRALLYRVAPVDPVTFVAVPVLMMVTAAVASWIPVARAGKVDPSAVLRAD